MTQLLLLLIVMTNISIMTLNVNGMRDPLKRRHIFQYCNSLNADLFLLQECHITSQQDKDQWANEWKGHLYASFGTPFSCGTVILVSPRLKYKDLKTTCDLDGRLFCLTLSLSSGQLQVCNVYAPNQPHKRKDFFNKLSTYITGSNNCILAGDFNCVPDVTMDRTNNSSHPADPGFHELELFIKTHRMYDTWRSCNPSSRTYTWFKADDTDASRLDRIYTSLPTLKCNIVKCPLSDHDAVFGTFDLLHPEVRGKGFWKLNNKILAEANFRSLFEVSYSNWKTLKSAFHSTQHWWDDIKRRTKELAIKYCVRRAHSDRNDFLKLLSTNPTKSSLEAHLDTKLQGAKIRARVTYLEGEEQPSSALFHSIAKRLTDKHIEAVRDDKGCITSDPTQITSVYQTFFTDLFAKKDTQTDLQPNLLRNISASPTTTQNDLLSLPISLDELFSALHSMKNNKSPGLDGLTKEFYCTFWHVIGEDLLEVFRDSLTVGTLTDSQKMGLITLAPKDGDNLDPRNKRPITLLNVDYKILAKTLSSRLASLMPDLIGSYQTCSVPGHSIHQNLWFVRDLIYYTSDRNLPCALVSLDQEKAFDRVDHHFLWKVLHKFNLHSTFITWIQTLYNGVLGKVIVNGFISDPFSINCGVRQGCPLSPLLYALFCDVLAQLFHSCNTLKGVLIPGGCQVKCTAYADDITCFVSDISSFHSLSSLLHTFERGTGAKLNMNKTCGLRLGKWKCKTLPFNAKWCDSQIKINGIWFGHDNPAQKTWNEKLIKLKKRLHDFQDRAFTLFGKASIINQFILPILFYPAMVYTLPTSFAKEIEKLIFGFVWSNKGDLVTRNLVYRSVNEGGLGLIHFPSKLRFLLCKQVYDAVVNEDLPHAYFLRLFCGIQLRHLFPPLFIPSNPHVLDPPYVYRYVLQVFRQIKDTDPDVDFSDLSLQRVADMLKKIQLGPIQYRKDLYHLHNPSLWTSVHCPLFDNRLKDISWRIAHNALRTNLKRNHWGIGDGMCPRDCPDFESVTHLFWECTFVDDLWSWFQFITSKFCKNWQISRDFALFGISPPPCQRKVVNLFLLVAAYIKRRVWLARCAFVFDNTHTPPSSVLTLIKSDIILHIKADFVRYSEAQFYSRYPCGGSSCLSVRGRDLVFSF